MNYLPPVMQVVLLALVVTAGIWDLRERRIPNWLVLFGLASGFGLNGFLFGLNGFWFSAQGMGLAMLIYLPLFAIRAMGGGDAKLMMAVGSVVGPGNWLGIFLMTAMLGGVLGMIVIVSRKRLWRTMENVVHILRELAYLRPPYLQRPELSVGNKGAVTLPHGAVITLAAMMYLVVATIWAPR
jgi:prepilin peptidase CpaA